MAATGLGTLVPSVVGDLAALGELLGRITVQVRGRSGLHGSGTLWSPAGVIVTNAHVARERQASVVLCDGRDFQARLIAWDPERDLAALRIEAAALPALDVGDSDALRAGELVVAVGNPQGCPGALTAGIIHAMGAVRGAGTGAWVQTVMRLAPGHSGGPLADVHGRVVGINAMIAGGLALAVPSNAVRRWLR
jgi:serine protease Do